MLFSAVSNPWEYFLTGERIYSHPYEKIPFQVSIRVWNDSNSEPQNFDFLQQDSSDPRLNIAKELVERIGATGSVVAYNKVFERAVLFRLAELFPQYKAQLQSIAMRLVDPWPVIQEHVYDKGFGSSYSLKVVAPALLGSENSYEGLNIKQGDDASIAFLKIAKGQASDEETAQIAADLLAYCSHDTLILYRLVKWLFAHKST